MFPSSHIYGIEPKILGGSQLGLASAVELASMGADIVINGRSQDKVDEAIDVVTSKVPNATIQGIAADLGTADGCKVMIAAVPDVDILVNNMGIYDPKAFENISDDDWELMFTVNVMSGVRLSRHYLPLLLKKNSTCCGTACRMV